ncbi:MAG: helicase [Acidimicrobiaceae bacterium]|nr:helicase [Acidimicrobiaceae bacterium]MXZ99319.1 helicase [Acidimicrobiaceae bacterium]MYE76780.1 helicase [Acidimicrobiaceae bacterium]MYE98054.1 helicase [Acidimicrobiaceae bacterium]MYH44259.1 helicase [Acidimicrobiaceae bacterium]
MSEAGGGELFIVDNSVSGWTGLEYLSQWTDVARSFDIATGFFEIGALLALDGKWQQLEGIRLLMGDEVSLRTHNVFKEALRQRVGRLDDSLEHEKGPNPFLEGVEAVVDAIAEGRIECRVYRKDKFHAKAYITHAKFDVLGAQALVGSSNFTRPGLTRNVELNIKVESGREVAQLQDWFETHWAAAEDVTEDVLRAITRHTADFTPFDVYAKALHEFFRGRELTAGEWDESQSRMFGHLDRYQQEAYWSLMKIARQHGGAFLCDGVGLGKTFVGLMLIERLVLHENKRVVLFAPKAAREGVWEPHLRRWLPHIGGVGGGADFSSLSVFSHTDLGRGNEFPERFQRMTDLADAVIVDEAHHFRNRGSRGDDSELSSNGERLDRRSRYWRLYDMLDGSTRSKLLFLLTATPVNNRLADFRHMAELFTRGDEAFFGRSLGVNHLSGHFNVMERDLQATLGAAGGSNGNGSGDISGRAAMALAEGLTQEARDALATDVVFGALVVQRSRSYAKASQIQERGESAAFPERKPPQVAEYSIRSSYRDVLDMFEKACRRQNPLFSLAIYYPLAHYIGPEKDIDPFEEGRQRQVVGLIRTMFLKRFESSVYAFEKSLDRLMRKLLAFVDVHSEPGAEQDRLDGWLHRHAEVVGYRPEAQLGLDFDGEADDDADEDVIPPELMEAVEELSRDEYDVVAIIDKTFEDLDEIVRFLDATSRLTPDQDDKVRKLTRLLGTKDLSGRKVLVFTEFADTARYVESQLRSAGIDGLARIDSGSKLDRAEVIRRFSPYYNGSSSPELARDGHAEIRVLVSTDVLSEGLNLQDATRLVNYDLHWNPVRLMQRIGRVDRRMSPETEERLRADHPEVAADRGTVRFWNFLPPEELERILKLYERVTGKVLMISSTLGIEGRKLLRPDDAYDPLREFNATYEGTRTAVEEMHLEYQALLKRHPELAERLDGLPGSVFSGRRRLSKGARGVFFCYSLPALDADEGVFTLEAGLTRWYLYDAAADTIVESPGDLIESIRSKPNTPRRCEMDRTTLKDLRDKVLRHVRDTYLKRVNAPIDAPEPMLCCWMELN